jgi:TctA family transporter
MKKTLLVLTMSLIFWQNLVLAATTESPDPTSLLCFPFFILIPLIYGLIWISIIGLSMLGLVLWIFMLIDLMQREKKDFPSNESDPKLMWLLIVLLTGYLGAIIYYFLVYRKVKRSK